MNKEDKIFAGIMLIYVIIMLCYIFIDIDYKTDTELYKINWFESQDTEKTEPLREGETLSWE